MELTQKELKRRLLYNPETGVFTWRIRPKTTRKIGDVAGSRNGVDGYHRICIQARSYLSHRLAWFYMTGKWPKHQIDHINCDPDDHRWANLRDIPKGLNQRNRKGIRPDNKLGIRGVRRNGKRFCANLQLGTYDTPELAGEAWRRAVELLGLSDFYQL